MALKGGTALNLFRFDDPRLSVDIDLNNIGAVDREGMLADRDPNGLLDSEYNPGMRRTLPFLLCLVIAVPLNAARQPHHCAEHREQPERTDEQRVVLDLEQHVEKTVKRGKEAADEETVRGSRVRIGPGWGCRGRGA